MLLMGIAMPVGSDTSPLLVTTSWDDGHPADFRLADLPAKHEASGTFHIPSLNAEGRAVMRRAEVCLIGQTLEVGGHTRDHVSMRELAADVASHQIIANKEWIEDLLGWELVCFAYVRRHHNRTVWRLVRDAGFRYARTVTNLSHAPGPDRYQVPTTMQFFPHPEDIHIRNFLSGGPDSRRMALLRAVLGKDGLLDRLYRAAELCVRRGGCLHIWRHSWELDGYDLCDVLDRFLAQRRDLSANFVTNGASWTHVLAPDTAGDEFEL